MTRLLQKWNLMASSLIRITRNMAASSMANSRSIHDAERSTVAILNDEAEGGLLINSYSRAGFRLNNGMVAIGPIAIFPKSILSWNVSCAEDITQESLSLFTTLDPKIDILVIGVGDRGQKVSHKTIQFMKEKKINLEILPTERACATFNFLNAERRCVAGAIIPPTTLRITDEDVVATQRKNKDFGRMKGEDFL